MKLTTNQKYRALSALGTVNQWPPVPGRRSHWTVSVSSVEVKDGGVLISPIGKGDTQEAAIDALWARLTELPPGQRVVVNAMGDDRREYAWDEFMWKEWQI